MSYEVVKSLINVALSKSCFIRKSSSEGRRRSFLLPYPQHAALNGLRRKVRNLPFVRGELPLHVKSVVVDNSGRGVNHRWSVHFNEVLLIFLRSLCYFVSFVSHSFKSLDAITCGFVVGGLFFVVYVYLSPLPSSCLAGSFRDVAGHTQFTRTVARCPWAGGLSG